MENDKSSNQMEGMMSQFIQVAQAFNILADRVTKEGHSDWVSEAMGLPTKKEMQADSKTNIIPKEAWKLACNKLQLPFEYIPRGNLNG